MTNLIIWSKDRACQLHLLLESLEKYAGSTFNQVYVIYTFSSKEYKDGYSLLMKRFKSPNFILESNFQDDTLKCISEKAENICFSTDDTVCFDYFDLPNLSLKDDVFSLRLGVNTLIQDHTKGSMQIPLNRFIKHGDTIKWNHIDYDPLVNYGYPCALDMHIFNREKIVNILREFSFKNTNELESNLTRFRYNFSNIESFLHSKVVNIPCNNMSNYTRINLKNISTVETLNASYIGGYIVSLPLLKKHKIIGCHQDIPYTMVKYG